MVIFLRNRLVDNYYIMVFFLYILTFRFKSIAVGFVVALILSILIMLEILQRRINIRRLSKMDSLVILYSLYCLFSGVKYIVNEISIMVFLKAVSNGLLPIIFYFIIQYREQRFWGYFIKGYIITGIIGIYLLYTTPNWYKDYCLTYGYSITRLSSTIGSTGMGALGVIALILIMHKLHATKCKKGKLEYGLTMLFCFLSMARSAWIVSIIALVVYHYLIFIKWKIIKIRWLIAEIICSITLLIVEWNKLFILVEQWIVEHIEAGIQTGGKSGLFSSRIEQWIVGLKQSNFIFGSGFGAYGHKAIGYNNNIVADGSWVLLICEIGIIGTIIFLYIVINSLRNGKRYLSDLLAPTMVILAIALQAIGSNMFEYQVIMPLFWATVGTIEKYRKEKKNEGFSVISSTVSSNS